MPDHVPHIEQIQYNTVSEHEQGSLCTLLLCCLWSDAGQRWCFDTDAAPAVCLTWGPMAFEGEEGYFDGYDDVGAVGERDAILMAITESVTSLHRRRPSFICGQY